MISLVIYEEHGYKKLSWLHKAIDKLRSTKLKKFVKSKIGEAESAVKNKADDIERSVSDAL